MGPWKMNGEQRIKWELLRLDLASACRLGREPDSGPSRGASRISERIQANFVPLAAAGSEEHLARLAQSVAKPVVSARVKVPTTAAAIVPENFLHGEQRRAFCNQEEWTLRPEPGGRPRCCNMISLTEEDSLRRKLLDCHAARLLPEEDAPHDAETGRVIAAGFFAVPHSEEWDRLIMDRRPLNHGEAKQRWMKLPLGGMLCKLVLPAHRTVRASGYDLATYFT